ncbi:hypothetical protein ACFW2N_31120, partial [Streptomyces sp. NPDC058855]
GQSAGSWQLSFDLAPAERVGEYQGFFGTGVTVARTLGPLVLTSLVVGWGTPGWLLLGAATLGASYAMGPATRRAHGRVGLGRVGPQVGLEQVSLRRSVPVNRTDRCQDRAGSPAAATPPSTARPSST